MKLSRLFSCIAVMTALCHCGEILASAPSSEEDAGDPVLAAFKDASGQSEAQAALESGAQDAVVDGGGCLDATRSNGVGETYKSCEPVGTYNLMSAASGCRAHLDDAHVGGVLCTTNPSGCSCPNPADCGAWVVMGFSSVAEEIVWDFGGPAKGHVVHTAVGGGRCPTVSDPTWN